MITAKAAAVLLCAYAAAALMRRRSAALRHAMLAGGFGIVCLLPLLERAAPAWGTIATAFAALPTAPPQLDERSIRAVWYGGTVPGLLLILVGVARAARISRSARPVDARLQTIADDVAGEFGIRRAVAVLQTDCPAAPLTWGLLRPTILVPQAAGGWSDGCLRSVLRHEFAHVQRGDWAMQLVAALLSRLFWFIPVAWLASRRLRLESERACDDAVLNLGTDGTEYARHLIDVARAMNARRGFSQFAMAAAGVHGFQRRIAATLDPQIDRTPLSGCTCAVVAMLLLAAAAPIAGFGRPPAVAIPDLLGVQREVLRRFGGEQSRFSIVADDVSFWKNRIEGRVELQARLNVDGSVSAVRIVEPVHPDLASAAEVIVRHWRREPARVRGVPVEIPIRMTVDFRR